MNARDAALLELDRRHLPGWPSNAIARPPRRARSPDDPRDVALAEHLTIGVIKNLLLLQHALAHYSGRTLTQIDPLVAKIIVIGLYQLRFMERIPPSAAVDEAVEQARRFGRARAAGFVNAVLRNATRDPDVPLPDPRDPQAYAAVALSHPRDVFRRIAQLVGDEGALTICRRNNLEPPTLVRFYRGVNVDQLQSPGLEITPHAQPDIYVVRSAKRATFEDWARRGLAQVQDATAARAVEFLDVRPGQRVLDRCAGLGTKTLQIRDALGEEDVVVAVDPHPRVDASKRLAEARGFRNIEVHTVAMLRDVPEIAPESFERILIDVPCSNSGVLARRPEARYAQDDRALESLGRLQRDILDDTAPHLAPGGTMVYSTCSIWPQENERQVEWFLRRLADFELVATHATRPSTDESPARYHDGGFIAVLRRRD